MKKHPLDYTTRLMASFLALLLLASVPANASDVLLYGVQKGQSYVQSTPDAPELAPENPYAFEAFAEGTGEGEIYSVFLTKPAGTASALPGGGFSYSARVVFSSLSAMNSLYRSGTYRFDFDSENDFFRISYVSLSGDNYPPTPHVNNYTAAQAIDPSASFAVRWDAFTGGTFDDSIELYVYDETDAVIYTDSGLDGTVTSDTIPANTLVAGKTYSAEVIFWRSVDFVFDDSGAFGFSFYYKSTRLTIATAGSGGNNPAPVLASPLLQSSGQFLFHIDGVAGRQYRIENTADFGSWDPVETITAPAGGSIDYAHTPPPGLNGRFYRVVLLP